LKKIQQDEQHFEDWTHLVFDQALLAEGGHIADPASFVRRMNQMLLQ
jgi:molecular chaperone HtpG